MKYRISSDNTTFEAEKTQEQLDEHNRLLIEKPEYLESWIPITEWSKKFPII